MGFLQVNAVIVSFLSLTLLLAAVASDYWVQSADEHTGLWQICKDTVCVSHGKYVKDYIHATRAFMLMGTLGGATSVYALCASFCRPFVRSISTIRIAAIASFVAGLCVLLGMSVFAGVYDTVYGYGTYGWSFGLGWGSGFLFLVTGGLAFPASFGTGGPTLKATPTAEII